MTPSLLPLSIFPRLERLTLHSKRRSMGTMQGKRRSQKLGSSLEFADYRQYSPGDDLRRFDWNVYHRTGKPFVRQYWDEQELLVSLYVDVSASMDFGTESAGVEESGRAGASLENKLLYAKQLAAAVGYVALSGHDRVHTAVFDERVTGVLPPIRGKANAPKLFNYLSQAEAGGIGNAAKALRQPNVIPRKPGMTWIFSDFWLEGGMEELAGTLSVLQSVNQEIVLVHVLSNEEVSPSYTGDLRLLDSELGTGKEMAVTGRLIDMYQKALKDYRHELSKLCSERGIRYVFAPSHVPLEQGIFQTLQAAGAIGGQG